MQSEESTFGRRAAGLSKPFTRGRLPRHAAVLARSISKVAAVKTALLRRAEPQAAFPVIERVVPYVIHPFVRRSVHHDPVKVLVITLSPCPLISPATDSG